MSAPPRLLSRPPSLAGALTRPRLDGLVGGARVVVVTGVAGSGVTTAAQQLAGERRAWCRLAAGYDRAPDLVAVAAASVGVELEPAHRVFDLAEQLLDLLEPDARSLVVDDHHLAADPDIDRLLAETAALLPAGARIVVASESRPAGLIGLVPARDLVVLDAGDLAFDLVETTTLLTATGGTDADAMRWFEATGGWPVALAAAERDPSAEAPSALGPMLDQLVASSPEVGEVFDLAASVPYVTPASLELLDRPIEWNAAVGATALLVDHGDHAVMADEAAALWRGRLEAERIAALRRGVAPLVAPADPATAIELLLDAGDHDDAADTLAEHLSTIGVERALTWLYRLPAELRRRFPPVLAAGQATVEVDVALADARDRVDRATSEDARREALLALGSVEAYRGELAAAATAFEAALRAAGDDAAFRERVVGELATTRFLLGDLVGAHAAAEAAAEAPHIRWLLAQLAVLDGSAAESELRADATPGGSAWDGAVVALLALARGDVAVAKPAAAGAYAAASDEGGDVLAAAAPLHAWVALVEGRTDDAVVVADELERRLGARHRHGRVHGALIRERVSRAAGDRGRHDRDARRLRDLRATGYAAIEQLLDAVLPSDSVVATDDGVAGGLVVEILGDHRVQVEGRTVGRDGWKSKKALEVLTVLALAERGMTREQVVEEIWPGRSPDKGRTLLRTALRDIRKVLEPDRPAGEPSAFVEAREDILVVDATTDLDLAESELSADPSRAFGRLQSGLAAEVASTDWGFELASRVERALISAAAALVGSEATPNDDLTVRIGAYEALIAAEPWQRSHYDALAELHRAAGDEVAAADVERRWFADDG